MLCWPALLIATAIFHRPSFHYIHIRYPCLRPCEVFPTRCDPGDCTYKRNDANGRARIVHIILIYWIEGREVEGD